MGGLLGRLIRILWRHQEHSGTVYHCLWFGTSIPSTMFPFSNINIPDIIGRDLKLTCIVIIIINNKLHLICIQVECTLHNTPYLGTLKVYPSNER